MRALRLVGSHVRRAAAATGAPTVSAASPGSSNRLSVAPCTLFPRREVWTPQSSSAAGGSSGGDGGEHGTDSAVGEFGDSAPSTLSMPESSFVKAINKEIEDEELRIDKDIPQIPKGWEAAHEEGTSYFTLRRFWTDPTTGVLEEHFVRVQLTTRDPTLDPEVDLRGEHFPFTLIIRNTQSSKVIDCTCDVIEGEFVVDKMRCYDSALLAVDLSAQAAFDRSLMYPGPNLDEAQEDTLDGIQAWLAARELDDPFAEFIVVYSTFVEQLEYERWLRELKSFILV